MKFSDKDLDVLYEDNHLLALNKPAGILSQPNQTGAPSLENWAKEFLKKKCEKPGKVFLHPIHRLDRPVSGIVLFAKTSKALSRLNAQMRLQSMQKIYLAKVEGHLQKKSGTLCHFLSHGPFFAKVGKRATAKKAVLFYTVQKEEVNTSFLSIQLQTGRYHQIRVQLAHIGHPILGDIKYGSRFPFFRLALHHIQLIFSHPITRERIIINSESPFT